MPTSTLPRTAPHHGSRSPKLRSSCDSCGLSKVKCDHNRPVCGRCSTLGLACVYGISRRVGKRSRNKPAIDVEAATRLKKPTTYSAEGRNHHMASYYQQLQNLNDFGQPEFPNLATDMTSSTSGIANTTRMNEHNQFSSALFSPMFLDEWPQLDNCDASLEIPSFLKGTPTADEIPVSGLDVFNPMRMGSTSYQSHSCPRESYEILRDLICPTPDLHAPEANSDPVSAQFDQVLHFTRNAIDRLTQVLKCQCGRSGHKIMVHASIVSRILLWYQQAAGWTWPAQSGRDIMRTSNSPSPSLSPEYETSVDENTTPTLAQSTGFVVEHVPVSMGILSIEDQNMQAAFRDQLVLSELKKMNSLIELLTSPNSREVSADGISGLHLHLGAWLRSEHARTVRILTTRLSTFNESLNLH